MTRFSEAESAVFVSRAKEASATRGAHLAINMSAPNNSLKPWKGTRTFG